MERAGDKAQGGRAKEKMEERGADMALLASAASVGLAWYQFYVQKNRSHGIFIGLWPPTILAFASYLNEKAIIDKLDNSFLGNKKGFESVRRLIE